MGAYTHLEPTRLLRDTCSIETWSAGSESTAHVASDSYSAAVTWRCNAIPKQRWDTGSPAMLKSELDVYLPGTCTVARKDRITHSLVKYRVVNVQSLSGGGVIAFCMRWEQVTG